MPGAGLADSVMPAVVPRNARLAINDCPGSVARPERLPRFAIRFEDNKEIRSCPVANFPFTKKVIASELGVVAAERTKFNTGNFAEGKALLMPIFGHHDHRIS